MDNFDLKKYLYNNPLLQEIKVNTPGKKNLILRGQDNWNIASLLEKDNPGLKYGSRHESDSTYLRKFKNVIQAHFGDRLNNGEEIPGYEEAIENFTNYLKSCHIPYKIDKKYDERTNYNRTLINIPINRVEILPEED